jgi:hypothetical protein
MTESVWMHLTISAYRLAHSRGQIKDMKRFAREIAESVISNFPSAPHMYALEQLMTDGALQAELWRDVLTIIDELEAKNGSTEVGGDSTGREGQQTDSRREPSATDDQPSWRPSASSGVDESAL